MQENRSLIDALTGGGEVVAEGEFTLDRDKAREKMQQFQLADPRRYVLELVQAAHLTGASVIEFQIDADDMLMRFDGRPFSATDFDQVYGSLFARGGGAALQARRHLALGLNAAMALNPRWVRVRSSNAALEIRPGEPDAIQTLEQAVAKTEIHVKERFRPGLVVQFFKDISGSLPEEIFIRNQCIYARAKILLDGALVTRDEWLPGWLVRVDLAGEDATGVAGLVPDRDPEVRLLTNGVWITTHPLDTAVPGFVAIVDGKKLTKDVSQARIVEDEAYKAVLVGLRRAELRCLEALCDLPKAQRNDWTTSVIKHALGDLKGLNQLREHATAAKLASVPIWRDARGGDVTISLARLVDLFDEEKKVPYSSSAVLNLEPDPAAPVPLITDRSDRQILTRLFGGKQLHNAVRKLNNQVAGMRNRRRWQARKAKAELGGYQSYLARGSIEADGVEGEVGIISLTATSSRLTLIKDGCLLSQETLELPVRGLDAAIQADFVPTRKFDGARRTDAWADALLAVARALPSVVQELVGSYESWPRRLWGNHAALRRFVIEYLDFALDPSAPERFLGACGTSRSASRRHTERSGGDRSRYAPALAAEAGDRTTPIERLDLFATLTSDTLSLAAIADRVRESGPVRYVGDDIELVPDLLPDGVLRLSAQERRVIRAVLGRSALVSFNDGYVAARLQREFRSKPKERAVLLNRGIACVPVETPSGICGEIAVLDSLAAEARDEPAPLARLRLLKYHRHLGHSQIALPFGPVVGVINFDQLTPDAAWKEVAPDGNLEAIHAAVVEAAGNLLEATCTVFGSGDPVARATARRALLRAARMIIARDQRLGLPEGAVETLAAAPLFPTVYSRSTSIANLKQHLEANGKIYVVDSGAGLAPAGDRLIVAVTGEQRRLLGELFGHDALEDSTEWLRAQHSKATFLRRAQLDQIRVTDVIVKSKIARDDVEGEIGLVSYHAGAEATAVLELFAERRRVAVLQSRGSYAYRARLNDANLPVDDGYNLIEDSPRIDDLRQLCLAQVPDLMLALADRWERLDTGRRANAWRHVLDFLAARGGSVEGSSDETEREVVRRFSALPYFQGPDQKLHSLDELRASVDAVGFLAYLTAPVPGRPLNPKQIVVLPSEEELVALRCLFRKVVEYDREWLEEQEGGRRRRRAPDLPEGPPQDALVTRAFRTGKANGVVWLPAEGLTPLVVQLGKHGKVAQTRRASAIFPCCGILTGEGLRVHRTWDAVDLTRRQERSLEHNARHLYDELRRQLEEKDGLADEARQRAERLLLYVAVQLYNAGHAPGSRVQLNTASRKLSGRLEQMPLIRTGSGRRISLRKAVEERIPELHALDVWQPRPAEPKKKSESRRVAAAPRRLPDEPAGGRDRPGVTEPAEGRRRMSEAERHGQAAERAVVEALSDELRWARDEHSELLSDANLRRMTFCDGRADVVARCAEHGIELYRHHPLVAQALAGFADRPVLITFLASAVYSALNLYWEEITDDHERDFHRALVDHVLTAYDSRPTRGSA